MRKLVYTLTFIVALLSCSMWTLALLGGEYAAYLTAAKTVTLICTVLLLVFALAESFLERLFKRSGVGLLYMPEPNIIARGNDAAEFPAAIKKIGVIKGKIIVSTDSRDSGNLYCIDPEDGMKVVWNTLDLESVEDFDLTQQGFIAKTWTGRTFKIDPDTGHAVEVAK